MRKIGKNRSQADSYGASEAATSLGVSIPTVKSMFAARKLDGFRTSGGHLRITAESVDAVRSGRQTQPRPVRDASPILQNRRERLEELTLEVQEYRGRRELEKLRQEAGEEAERRAAEAQAREEEAARRQAEVEMERERRADEQALERARLERERAQQLERREAEQGLAAFHARWTDKATEAVSSYEYRWLSAVRRKSYLPRSSA